jgi:cytochrome P450
LGKKVRGLFAPVVEARVVERANGSAQERRDILDALLDARHPVSGQAFTAQELVDQLALIFLAGHETTATSLGWALYLLSECPDMQERLWAEIESVTGGAPLDFDHVKALEGVRNLYREALRLYPPVAFLPRTPHAPITMREKAIEAGELMMVAPGWFSAIRVIGNAPTRLTRTALPRPKGSKRSRMRGYLSAKGKGFA